MSPPKDYRISLAFSRKDKDHEEVVSYLKKLGRKKSKFITLAVKFYLDNSNIKQLQSDDERIQKIVRDILQEKYAIEEPLHQSTEKPIPLRKSIDNVNELKPIKENQSENAVDLIIPKSLPIESSEIPDEDMEFILNGLQFFN